FGLAGGGEDDTNSVNTPLGSPLQSGGRGVRSEGAGAGTNSGGAGSFPGTAAGVTHSTGGVTNSGFGRRGRFGRGGFGGFGGFGFGPRVVDWQNDAKYYQFWVHGDDQGNFTIPNIRPGTYSLYAIADGVLGQFTLSNITVAA